jgi:uncharacterized protein YcbX
MVEEGRGNPCYQMLDKHSESSVNGHVQSIWRHPVKGFTPERLEQVTLAAGDYFPLDRMYAVEDGPSGFDPANPQHISKQKFTVLAKIPAVANIRTRFDDRTGLFEAAFAGKPPLQVDLTTPLGRTALGAWLTDVLGEDINGPLQVLPAVDRHRFMDHPKGYVSIVNLASVRDLETKVGRRIDPRRFRANIYVEGWPAWTENDQVGSSISLGEVRTEVFKPIVRCVATHVDPDTAAVDVDVVKSLFDAYGHMFCGVYVSVTDGGRLAVGEPARLDVSRPPL